jgi:hypothetical protein
MTIALAWTHPDGTALLAQLRIDILIANSDFDPTLLHTTSPLRGQATLAFFHAAARGVSWVSASR